MTTAKLTPKQAKWVSHYLICGNASASAVKAGYSEKGASVAGHRMLSNVSVQKALQARQKADATRLSIQREDVLKGLLDAFEMARELQEPMAMVAASRELGKLLGFYAVERVEVDLNLSGDMARMQAMSDAELLAVIEAGAAATDGPANSCIT